MYLTPYITHVTVISITNIFPFHIGCLFTILCHLYIFGELCFAQVLIGLLLLSSCNSLCILPLILNHVTGMSFTNIFPIPHRLPSHSTDCVL